ncbi:hypothetical protein ACHAWO_005455 [Cyclotella atomus]|uniref:Peptidase M11 gametolysin domain-containing protein n=1 Tax=Cyclotella atomus TaxID=382360 RepID=A0ABD3QWF2_9STRA
MRNAITAAINAEFGVSNPSALANHVMYCLPTGTMSGIAYAYINSWNSVYSNEWCNYVSGQMHEIGHKLNFAHSNEALGPYKDQTGMMGYSYGSDDGPLMCFNAAKSYQTGWYPTKTVTPVTSSCGDFDGKLFGVSDYGKAGGPGTTIIKINVSNGGPDFFINYNKQSGVNSGTKEAGNQVTIVSAAGEGTGYAESELVAKLIAGASYTISNFEGTGKDVTVTFEGLDTTVSPNPARVVISYDGMVCGSSTSSPITQSPTKSPITSAPVTGSPTKHPITPSPSKAPVNSAPVTPSPSKKPTDSPTRAPVTPPPTRAPVTPCWDKGATCDPNGVHNCCNGCQSNGKWAGTCK